MEDGLSTALARLITRAAVTDFPADAIAAARRAFIDTIGVMLAGRRETVVAIVRGQCRNGDDSSAVLGGGFLSAQDAALLNGVAGHVLDYDDVALHGHPSVVLVPAILAEAQRLNSSPLDALKAYVIGFESWAELGLREPDAYHLGSWHPTPFLGIIAATSAVAALNRLDGERARNALAIATSMASGVIANFGTHTKPLQAGRAAANAIAAVQLAIAGITGASDAIESPHGLLHGISPRDRVDTTSPVLLPCTPWRLLQHGLSVKRYPVCYASHRTIDAVIDLARDAGLDANAVRSVTAKIGIAQAKTLRHARPLTGLEARFSLHHNVAAALLDGQVGFAQLTDGYVRRPDLVALLDRTHIEVVDEECPEQPGMARFDRVVIETVDGAIFDSGGVRYARGHAKLPLSDAELDAKFLDCARYGGAVDCAALLSRLRHFEERNTLGEVLGDGFL